MRVDWESLKAARSKYRKAVGEAECLADERERANLTHTLSKLGIFLDEALHGAFGAADTRVPDTAPRQERNDG